MLARHKKSFPDLTSMLRQSRLAVVQPPMIALAVQYLVVYLPTSKRPSDLHHRIHLEIELRVVPTFSATRTTPTTFPTCSMTVKHPAHQ